MKVTGLIEVTPSQIECKVRELFKRRPDIKCTPPIRLEYLIENTPNVRLEVVMGLVKDHRVEGGILKQANTRQLTVFVDWTIATLGSWADYGAVLGEEFAHLELHQSLLLQVQSVEDFLALQKHPEWDRYERDAKRYSRVLRMPADIFVPAAECIYREVIDEFGFGPFDVTESRIQHRLSQLFRVPPGDALRRMRGLPLQIDERIMVSTVIRSSELVPSDCIVAAKSTGKQQAFNGFVFDE